MDIKTLFDKLTSRKLLVAVGLGLIATICLFMKIATFDQWTSFSEWILGLYCTGNISEYLVKKPSQPTPTSQV